MLIKEKRHRLQDRCYTGEISVAFTLCVKNRFHLFRDAFIVNIFFNLLKSQVENSSVVVPVYCFMPDHLHLVLTGTNDSSDSLKFIMSYKQKTSYWLSKHQSNVFWQKDFYDRIIRKNDGLLNVIRYILDNPVRRGLVSDWRIYPFSGAVGYNLEEILSSLV